MRVHGSVAKPKVFEQVAFVRCESRRLILEQRKYNAWLKRRIPHLMMNVGRGFTATTALVIALGLTAACDSKSQDDAPGKTESVGVSEEAPARCPLSGLEAESDDLVGRPAVAVKIENAAIAYPLSGLEDAEIVYEEPVEGGLTRFMAIYHCTDSAKVGPVRSARMVDPAIMSPYTRILAAAGGNETVLDALEKEDVVLIDEKGAGDAMTRIPRDGLPPEHTLYGNVSDLRAEGATSFDSPPAAELFEFGSFDAKARDVRSVTLDFSSHVSVRYEWNGQEWLRFDNGERFETEDGDQVKVDNVIIEEHTVNLSETLRDSLGTPSPEIEDVTGSGRAILLRDKLAIEGKWIRKSEDDPVRFETSSGDEMVLHEGTTWIELLPDNKGDVKGSFTLDGG